MNYKTFPVATTTVFPISNSVAGGQLLTEYNLRCKDFVSSWSEIGYDSATSFVHGAHDFDVRVQQDDTGVVLSNSTLEVMPGTAIINGHYVKQEAVMSVDLLEGNKELQLRGENPLTGKLAIGLRVYYSTESTMVGALAAENDDDVYEGLQLVVQPASKLITPEDSPHDQTKVNCNLKLATFTFLDNEIRGVVNNAEKIKNIDAERISNIDSIISGDYVSKAGINPKKLYVLAGKNVNGTVNNTWCDATDSLFVWDSSPVRVKDKPKYAKATFDVSSDGTTQLVLPHKNIDGMKVTLDEKNPEYKKDEYYKDVTLPLPAADYSTNTAGTVTPSYTRRIKAISTKLDSYFQIVKGKQVAYIETLNSPSELPKINSNWKAGDYTLVNVDNYALQAEGSAQYTRPPSTLYALLPGAVKGIKFFGKGVANSSDVPSGLTGVQLGTTVEKDTAPITSKTVKSSELTLKGTLGDTDIVPTSAKYTTPEGIVYQDDGQGFLTYSESNNDAAGNPTVLEADITSFESDSTQLFTIAKQTVGANTGYAIQANGTYLSVTKEKPFKLYFSKTLTEYGLFIFVDTDNQSQLSSTDIAEIITSDKSKRKIRPVEMLCTALILQEQVTGTNLLTDVSELVAKVNALTDEKSNESIPYMKTLVDNVTKALEMQDSDSAVSLASQLKSVVDKVFDSDTDKNKSVRKEVDEAKTAVDAAAADDTSSVQTRVEAVKKAYNTLDAFMHTLQSEMDALQTLVDKVQAQVDATKVGGVDYNIYGRVTAYSKNGISYVYVSENRDMQEQMWQVLETGSSVSIVNSCYGLALTQQDAKKLKETKYIINYEDGSISGLPMIGSASYDYYSTNILQDLLNYFTVTDETHGVANEDYFIYRYRIDDSNFQDYYYVVTEEGTREWSKPVWLTGTISLATTEMIGGFLNVPDTALDGGYVRVNDEGYLQLMDYDLLRTGAAAYQLGEDVEVSAGISSSEIQTYLNNYVNDRVAFPNSHQVEKAKKAKQENKTGVYTHSEVIHLTVNISAEDAQSQINISNIDSRFGASVFLHITGSANSKNVIYLENIEKLRIDSNMEYDESDPPVIAVKNCGLYYDASVLNRIAVCNRNLATTGMENIHFWYEKYEESDPDLVVNDMTISEVNAPKITDVIDFWNATSPNDNHYHVALHSITFANDGTVWGAGLLVANDTTANIQDGHFVTAAKFTLPQGAGLNYPDKLVTRQLKFTGTFESGYMTDGGYVMQDTKFTALTQKYSVYDNASTISGSILFHVECNIIPADFGGVSTEGWESDTFHLFQGAAI